MKIYFAILVVIAGCSSTPNKGDSEINNVDVSPTSEKARKSQPAPESSAKSNANRIDERYQDLSQFIQARNWDRVEQQATQLLGMDSKDKLVLNALGLANMMKNKPKAARYFFNQALAVDPNSSELLNNMGIVSKNEGNSREAIYYWRKSLSLNKNNLNAFINLVSEFAKVKDYRKVMAASNLVNSKNLKHTPTIINMAIANSANGQFDEAEALYKRALDLDGNNQVVLLNMALFYIEHKSNLDLGRKYLDRLSFLGVQSNIQASFSLLENKLSMMSKTEQSR